MSKYFDYSNCNREQINTHKKHKRQIKYPLRLLDIDDFLVDRYEHDEYEFKMLIYGNYTLKSNLESDSFVQVIKPVMDYLDSRYKIHFTLVAPENILSLFINHDERKQSIGNFQYIPSYPNTMRTHFDANEFLNIIDWKRNDFDIIYSHVPEHTNLIANAVYNNTNMTPKIIGYSHWFEVPQNAKYDKTMFRENISGILEMEECGVNSEWLKNLVIDFASQTYSPKIIKDLEKIIQPHYLGVEEVKPREKDSYRDKTVVFNHRASGYTGWRWFVKQMDELWEDRQDFVVYTTLTEIDRPWNKAVHFPDKKSYMEFMQTVKFGVGAFQEYSAWSLSTTDGLSVGVPYLLPDNFCYPEMVPTNYPYLYRSEDHFRILFNQMLDNPIEYDTTDIVNNMLWNNKISEWFGGWGGVFKFKCMKHTDVLQGIIEFIKNKKFATKEDIITHLNWGMRIKWSNYRNALREHTDIRFTKKGYEYIGD